MDTLRIHTRMHILTLPRRRTICLPDQVGLGIHTLTHLMHMLIPIRIRRRLSICRLVIEIGIGIFESVNVMNVNVRGRGMS